MKLSKRQHSINEKSKSEKSCKKRPKWLDEYKNALEMKEVAVSDSSLERMADDIVEWAIDNKDALVVTDFFNLKGISYRRWLKWVEKNELLSEAYQLAKEIIGGRREGLALKKKIDGSIMKSTQAHYSPVWRDEQRIMANMEQRHMSNITVSLEKMPETDIVPLLDGE